MKVLIVREKNWDTNLQKAYEKGNSLFAQTDPPEI